MSAEKNLSRQGRLPAPILSEKNDPVASWFAALEELDEFIGLRFGRIHSPAGTPEWTNLRQAEFDGIGGFAGMLRERGANLARLPRIKHPARPGPWSLLRGWVRFATPRQPVEWGTIEGKTEPSSSTHAPAAVAWHIFDEESTVLVRRICRRQGITVNSFLLKHLTRAIRPFLREESSPVPWMISVNLRGKVLRDRDTANHSSYIAIKVQSYETPQEVHQSIYRALGRAEHWANWYAYNSGRFLGMRLKKAVIRAERFTSQSNAGSFANLGDWDPEKKLTQSDCAGPWIFCPPVFRSQLVGAGAVTFQNRLSLAIQAHPELTTSSNTLWVWLQNWLKEIQMDLSSLLEHRS